MTKPHRRRSSAHDARADRRLAHLYGELSATSDRLPLASRERVLLHHAARAVRAALATAPPEDDR